MLRALSLNGDDIGVTASLPVDFGEVTREVYVPLSLSRGEVGYGAYRVVVFPNIELETVSYEVSTVGNGFPSEVLLPKQPLGYRRYSNAFPVEFDFELREETGLYRLRQVTPTKVGYRGV